MRSIRRTNSGETTVKISVAAAQLLDRVSWMEDRSRKGEVVFLIKERAKMLGIEVPQYQEDEEGEKREVVA